MMKKLWVLVILIASINCQAQTNYINVCVVCSNAHHSFDFYYPTDSTNFFFRADTSQSNNLWQLGTPMKTVFNSGYGGPRAFVTDTINTYPINNISSFQFSIINCDVSASGWCGGYGGALLTITTKVNSDASLDGGTIEVSHNSSSWSNIIYDPLAKITGDIYSTTNIISSMNKPGYSGTNNNWKQIQVEYGPAPSPLDTITFRFSFTSDSIDTHKDGWMIGWILIQGMFEGIQDIYSSNFISVTPNPTKDNFTISFSESVHEPCVIIFNNLGEKVFEKNVSGTVKEIPIHFSASAGIYFLKIKEGEKERVMKIAVAQ